jgi:hypothetical protein
VSSLERLDLQLLEMKRELEAALFFAFTVDFHREQQCRAAGRVIFGNILTPTEAHRVDGLRAFMTAQYEQVLKTGHAHVRVSPAADWWRTQTSAEPG